MFASESSTSFPAAAAVPPKRVLVYEIKQHYQYNMKQNGARMPRWE